MPGIDIESTYFLVRLAAYSTREDSLPNSIYYPDSCSPQSRIGLV